MKKGFFDKGAAEFNLRCPLDDNEKYFKENLFSADFNNLDLAIVHVTDEDWRNLIDKAKQGSIRIRVSSAGFQDRKPEVNGKKLILHLHPPAGALERGEWDAIIQFFQSKQKGGITSLPDAIVADHVLRPFFDPPKPRYVQALFILLQTYITIKIVSEEGMPSSAPCGLLELLKSEDDELLTRLKYNMEKKTALVDDVKNFWQAPLAVASDLNNPYGNLEREWQELEGQRDDDVFQFIVKLIKNELDFGAAEKAYNAIAEKLKVSK